MHTKGKWIVEENGDMYIVSMVNDYKRYVCRIGTTNSTTNGENLANAKRIVQMNNSFDGLLEALRNIEKGEGAFSIDQLSHAENTIEDMKEIARIAIAKAEGD